MVSSVYHLRDFYRTLGGRIVRRLIRERLTRLWPDVKSLRLLGAGYAAPYLKPYIEDAERVVCVMPEGQGVHHWPQGGANLACLAGEGDLPFETNSVDRILLIHSLEFTGMEKSILAELWRVLRSNGRIMVVVPNRHGLWARADRTPFGIGTPFSARQVQEFLTENQFMVEARESALFIPPFRKEWLLRTASLWERAGSALCPRMGGVLFIEASKQVYALTGKGLRQGVAKPSLKPATASCTVLK